MSKKQASYLDGLLDGDETTNTPERVKPTTLLSRGSALARVQSGEVKQVTQLELDPSRVKIWPGNARHYSKLNEHNCADLLDALVAEGGQKIPAIVRRLDGDPDADYEVIAGSRRHWSISWLRKHSYPDFKFLAHVHNLDDEAAFRLADIENRSRKDVSDIERARNYLEAINKHYGGKQRRMAERLKVSEGWLSKMLKVASLPDNILAAFGSLDDILLKPAYELAKAYDDNERKKGINTEARVIALEQEALILGGKKPLTATQVIKRLVKADRPTREPSDLSAYSKYGKTGRVSLSVESCNRQGVTVRVHAGSGEDVSGLTAAFKDIVDKLKASGIIAD